MNNTKLNPIHEHQFKVQPPKPRAGLFVRELKHTARKGVFGVLSPEKSIHGGPTEVTSFHYAPKHATRNEAKLAAERYLKACTP
jgi:hypothetical protein